MAEGHYLYTDDRGTAHAVADMKLVPSRYQARATFVAAKDGPAGLRLPPLSDLQGPLVSAVLPVVGLILVWRKAQGFLIRTALVVAVAIWGYFKLFDKFVGSDALKPTRAAPQAESPKDEPAGDGEGTVEVIVHPPSR